MAVLDGLKPERVFHFFEEICGIPHGSGNTKAISDHLVAFAKERNLKVVQDGANNVVIYKPAAPGYEDAPVTILQGHCDMVAEKTPDSDHDFLKDGLKLQIDGDDILAEGTTLGGDDGIAVAYIMAVLDDDTLKHPALECVITTDEEIGLLGAQALDASLLSGKYLLNMDSEEEGYVWVGCAGGMTGVSRIPVTRQRTSGEVVEVMIHGLNGGHSGAEIDKIRANSNKLIGRFLYELGQRTGFALADVQGGTKDNAIPRQSKALLVTDPDDRTILEAFAEEFQNNLQKEFSGTDGEIRVSLKFLGEQEGTVLSMVSKEKVIFFLMQVPYGIAKMSGNIPGLVETSDNLGILEMTDQALVATCSIRSSVKSGKEALSHQIQYLTEFLGGEYTTEGDYPAWEYREDSRLRDLMVDMYEKVFGERPEVKAIHAGLECGLFYDKLPGLDCVSFGPNMKDIHTTEERLSIASTARIWKYLVSVLENIR